MNSDPYDSAAWRTFGMLDADESAMFDEAMRVDPVLRSAYLEMDRLSAAIAAATTIPVEPKDGQLDRLMTRLGLHPTHRLQFWLAVTGWAAAAVLAAMLILRHPPAGSSQVSAASHQPAESHPLDKETPPAAVVHETGPAAVDPTQSDGTASAPPAPAVDERQLKATNRAETKRLVQEIEVLRDNLERFQSRDRILFEPIPGRAMPIVMTMSPPGLPLEDSAYVAKSEEHSPLTSMLGDAVRVMTATSTGSDEGMDASGLVTPPSLASDHPMAIPIYDSARDSGTLVVNNLPAVEDGEAYNLWVKTVSGGKPIYVGSLPASSAAGSDSFDFSLGSTMVLPSGFLLTKDPVNSPATPSDANTVLEGPPIPGS